MKNMQRCSRILAGSFLAFAVAGCGGAPDDQPPIGHVTGTVTLDGQPLPKARIMFSPADSRPSGAMTDDAGHYELIFNDRVNGAAVGKHTVRITLGTAMEPEKLPQKYNIKSELTADVVDGENPPINFDLKTK